MKTKLNPTQREAAQLCSELASYEVQGQLDSDLRGVLRDERQTLMARFDGDVERLSDAVCETVRVLRMWGLR